MPEKDQIKVVFEIFSCLLFLGFLFCFVCCFLKDLEEGSLYFKKYFIIFFVLSFVYETDIEN